MADLFIDAIATELQTYIDSQSLTAHPLDWNIVKQLSPAQREYSDLPSLIICPQGSDQIKSIAFHHISVITSYSIILVKQGTLTNTYTDFSDDLLSTLIKLFMPAPTSLTLLGCYLCEVKNNYSIDRAAFKEGHITTANTLEISFDKKEF